MIRLIPFAALVLSYLGCAGSPPWTIVDIMQPAKAGHSTPTFTDVQAYDQAMQPTIDFISRSHGFWENGTAGFINLPLETPAEMVVDEIMYRDGESGKYQVLRVREIETDDSSAPRVTIVLMQIGDKSETLIFYPVWNGGATWWYRPYKLS